MRLRPLAALLAALLLASAVLAGEQIHLVVLHTNDVHGQVLPRRPSDGGELVGGLPRAAAVIARIRREESGPRSGVLVVDAGDWWQGTPEGRVDDGVPYMQAMTALGYDAQCVGNHDLDSGLPAFDRLLAAAHPKAICANVWRPDGRRLAEPWRIVTVAGLRVGLVGLLTTETPSIGHVDTRRLRYQKPELAVAQAKVALRGQVDLILPVAHIGIDEARPVARAHPELPLIVTGHTHKYLKDAEHEGRTLIVQAGSRAVAIGRVDLWLDGETRRVTSAAARLIRLDRDPAPEDRVPAVEEVCARLVARSEEQLSEVVGHLDAPLRLSHDLHSSPAGNWMTDVLRAHAGADVAITNRGGIRTELPAGPVTRRNVFELCPFDNTMATLTLTGRALAAMVARSFNRPTHSGFDWSGMRVFVRLEAEGLVRLARIEVHSKPLELGARYRVATSSFLASGSEGLEELGQARERDEGPTLVRDVLEQEFRRKGHVMPPSEDRLVIEGAAP